MKDVTVTSDRNIIQKHAEKKVKCKNLSIEIQVIWYRKYLLMSQVSLPNDLKLYMEMIPDCHSLDCLQVTDIRRELHIIRKVLAVRNLKPDWWNATLVQEDNYQDRETEIN